jgi:tRNA uridine 5-carbamoylmethylation protein Kti12
MKKFLTSSDTYKEVMTKVLSLVSGPGVGKSTVAAKLFAALKCDHKSVELCTEYVKSWAWENRKPVDFDQFFFFGKQSRRECSLFGNVDLVVTDAPVLLTSYYA